MEGLTPADVLAMQNNGKSGGIFDGDGLIILLLFFLFAGNGFGNGGSAMSDAVTRAEMADGFNMSELKSSVTGIGSQLCNGFSEVNRNIDATRYEAAQNTCRITTTVHEEAEATRALITQNTIQDLRDRLAEKDNLLQSANLTLANAAQTQNILGNMGRYVPYQGCGTQCNCTGLSTTNW